MINLKDLLTEKSIIKVMSEEGDIVITEAPKIDRKEQKRIKKALEPAATAFWAVIAKKFPEIKTGDIDPGASMAFDKAMEDIVTDWYQYNKED